MSDESGFWLVLIRHAKSDYPWGVDDHDRPLNDRGRRDAPGIGTWLDEHVAWADGEAPRVRVSSARRAQLTWSLASSRLSGRWDAADIADEPRIYEASVPTLLDIVAESGAGARTLVLVGHNPGMVDLVRTLGRPDARSYEATAKFPTSAIAVLRSATPLPEACGTRGSFEVTSFAVPRGPA
jgi:phosphohistidine phosphatase